MIPVATIRDVAQQVCSAPARAGVTRVTAVDGPSGAGKTTYAARLANELAASVVHMDDLYPGWDGLADAIPALVSQILQPLAEGRPGRYRRWDWKLNEYAEWIEMRPSAHLVIEGVGCGARSAAPYLSLLIWIDAPRNVRMARGIARDGVAYEPHWQRWAAQEKALFAAEQTKSRADVLVEVAG